VHCPHGKFGYQASHGGGACQECGFGFYQTYFGKSDCDACPAGLYANAEHTECGEAMTEFSDAITCPEAGKFKDQDALSCTLCPAGKFGEAIDYSLDATCQDCEYGQYSDAPGALACTACPDGQFSSSQGMTCSTVQVGNCEAGRFHQENDPDPAECAACPAGKFGYKTVDDIGVCETCPEGTVTTSESLTVCTACPTGEYSTLTGDECTSTQPACPPGKFNNDGYCHGCPVGKFGSFKLLDAEGGHGSEDAILMSTTETDCYTCAPGSFTNTIGNTECQSCGANMYSSFDSTGCTARRGCANGPATVVDGWKGPGYGPNYCNMCYCSDTVLSCSQQACAGYGAKEPCSHVSCTFELHNTFDGFVHHVIKSHHALGEQNGKNIRCGYSIFEDKCECMCEH
jgi:hypothetical protein